MKNTRANGFTLIEMVVSLVLLSLISVIGYQGLAYSASHWQKGHDSMVFQYDHHQAVSWIRSRTGSAEKVKYEDGSNFAYFFNGNRQSLEFVTSFTRTRRGGLYVNKVSFDPLGKKIIVSYRLYHPDTRPSSQNTGADKVTLLSGVRSLTFSYYGRNKSGRIGWHESWTNHNSLPKLIKLDIVDRDGQNYQSTIHVATSNNV